MRHYEIRELLHDFVDEELEAPLRQVVEQHLRDCRDCTSDLAFLRNLRQQVRTLPREMMPERDLWVGIANELQPAAAAPERSSTGRDTGRHGRGWWPFPLPSPVLGWTVGGALAAAALALMLWWPRAELSPVGEPLLRAREGVGIDDTRMLSALERECMGAGKMLLASLESTTTATEPGIPESFTLALQAVDAAIDETRLALGSAPDDPELLRLLTLRYQQKLALLHGAMRTIEEA